MFFHSPPIFFSISSSPPTKNYRDDKNVKACDIKKKRYINSQIKVKPFALKPLFVIFSKWCTTTTTTTISFVSFLRFLNLIFCCCSYFKTCFWMNFFGGKQTNHDNNWPYRRPRLQWSMAVLIKLALYKEFFNWSSALPHPISTCVVTLCILNLSQVATYYLRMQFP